MYLSSILWFLSWPVFLAVSYFVIQWIIKRVELKNPPGAEEF